MAAQAALSNDIILTSIFTHLYYTLSFVRNRKRAFRSYGRGLTNAICVNKTWADIGTYVLWGEEGCVLRPFLALPSTRRSYYAAKLRSIAARHLSDEDVADFHIAPFTGLNKIVINADTREEFLRSTVFLCTRNMNDITLRGRFTLEEEGLKEALHIISVLQFPCNF
jgi:hypothetical protein